MTLKAALQQIHSALLKGGVGHALIGGFALAVHGINRATGDIDLLVDEADRDRLKAELAAEGYKVDSETAEVIHFAGPARLDVLLARRPLSRQMLARAPESALLGVKCLEAEDIVGLKIQAYVNNPRRALQDQADIVALLRRYPAMDLGRVKVYADLFRQWETIRKLKDSSS